MQNQRGAAYMRTSEKEKNETTRTRVPHLVWDLMKCPKTENDLSDVGRPKTPLCMYTMKSNQRKKARSTRYGMSINTRTEIHSAATHTHTHRRTRTHGVGGGG